MKWNAFGIFQEAIDRTKSKLSPFSFSAWFKLAIVAALSSYGTRSGGGNSGSYSSPSTTSEDGQNITGKAISEVSNLNASGLLGFFIGFGVVIGLILSFITSVFSFIYIDALVSKSYSVKKGWNDYAGKGFSFFLFKLGLGILFLLLLFSLALPFLLKVAETGFLEYFEVTPLMTMFWDALPSLVLIVAVFVIFSVLVSLIVDFGVPFMYKNPVTMLSAAKEVLGKIMSQKMESFVYLIAKFIFSILVSLIVMVIFILTLLVMLLVFGIVGFIVYLLLQSLSSVILISLLVLYGIIFFITLFIVLMILSLPFTVFLTYFSLIAYEKLFKTKL